MKPKNDRYDLNQPSRSGAPGFDLFQSEKDKKYYFQFNDRNGKPLFFSEGYSHADIRDKGLQSVKTNAAKKERYKVNKEKQLWYFILKAGNHREIGRSRYFKTEKAMEKDMKYMQSHVNTAQPLKTKKATPIKTQPVKSSNQVKDIDIPNAPKYTYRIDLYPRGANEPMDGKIINTRTLRKQTFTGLDTPAISKFMSEDVASSSEILSGKSEGTPVPKQDLKVDSKKVKKGAKSLVSKRIEEMNRQNLLDVVMVQGDSSKPTHNLPCNEAYKLRLYPKKEVAPQLKKNGNHKIALEIVLTNINQSYLSYYWIAEEEMNDSGAINIEKCQTVRVPGIYHLTAKAKNFDMPDNLTGSTLINFF